MPGKIQFYLKQKIIYSYSNKTYKSNYILFNALTRKVSINGSVTQNHSDQYANIRKKATAEIRNSIQFNAVELFALKVIIILFFIVGANLISNLIFCKGC